jgi:hypothetical protein
VDEILIYTIIKTSRENEYAFSDYYGINFIEYDNLTNPTNVK